MKLNLQELNMMKHQLELTRAYRGHESLGSQVHEPWHDELYDKVLGEIKMLEAGKDTEECECNWCRNKKQIEYDLKEQYLKVYKPWGWYKDLYEGPEFKAKMLCIHEGKRISLQRHHWRSEVWTIAAGSGAVFLNDEWHLAHPKMTFEIPDYSLHRAKSLKGDFYILELQHGKELYEEDIERVEDDYGRTLSLG